MPKNHTSSVIINKRKRSGVVFQGSGYISYNPVPPSPTGECPIFFESWDTQFIFDFEIFGVTLADNGDSTYNATVEALGGDTPYEYSIDGGVTWQSSNVFSGLVEWQTYVIKSRDAFFDTIDTTITPSPIIDDFTVSVNIDSFDASWGAIAEIVGYNLYLDEGSGYVKQNTSLITGTSFNVPSFSGDSSAYVAPVKDGIEGARSNIEQFAPQISATFQMHSYGNDLGTLEIYVIDESATILETVYSEVLTSVNAWQEITINYKTPDVPYRIVWRHYNNTGFEADLAVDEITIVNTTYGFESGDDGFRTIAGVQTTDVATAFASIETIQTTATEEYGKWCRSSGSTASSGTGPPSAYAGTYYLVTEASAPNDVGTNFWLFSPEITP